MERGPMALFGALVAVGLGPALWLGAQFGNVTDVPGRPPTGVVEQRQDLGGKAGSAPDEDTTEVETRPRSNVRPLDPDPTPARTKPKPPAKPDPSPSSAAPGAQPGPSSSPSSEVPVEEEEETTTPPPAPPTEEETTPPPADPGISQLL